ncbi:MAG TPA: GNAT family N-acetyltransferase [Thermoplasmata archaeon]|nr:GNAT family N-acetyltransferase [Thermoplasmata archaeon]
MVLLAPMTEAEFDQWLEHSIPDYARQHVRAGNWNEEEALGRSRQEHAQLLPNGLRTPEHFFFTIRAEPRGERVGELWYAFRHEGPRTDLYVYWVGIDEAHRRRGYARETFALLEPAARQHGAGRILLHVFGDNLAAMALYERIGFITTNVMMEKPIV